MLATPSDKYVPAPVIRFPQRTWPSKQLEHAPRWCSTDLRDGNQSLANPMNIDKKLKFFHHLVTCGFKEIEVAFPSASQTDFDFVRQLIENALIPDDVTIQVITQSRPDLIERTIESLLGAAKAIVHLYNATAPAFREIVFNQDRQATLALAVKGVQQIRALCEQHPETQWTLEYSPETFNFTEPEFALEICQAVAEVWQPCDARPLIINLPTTVERNTPNVFADQIEHFIHNLHSLAHVTISVHPHNDRGTGVASAELAMLAGATRVEGCLFGNGERTGNVDLVTLALNLYSQGINPQLRFADMQKTVELVEQCNELPVHPRHPYAGRLVFTAFSGSHQDAIKKGFARYHGQPHGHWNIPYLPIDPMDLGCNYEEVIRVNSQSGKSGAAWLLQENHGLVLPKMLQVDLSKRVKNHTDRTGSEMNIAQLWQLFRTSYGVVSQPFMSLQHYHSQPTADGQKIEAQIRYRDQVIACTGCGIGLMSALLTGLMQQFDCQANVVDYHEHTLGTQTHSKAASYVQLQSAMSNVSIFGVAIEEDATKASLQALLNAYAQLL
ncbi:2-isopropylmalate synthase [Vibrio gazogenes]|uniref:2-isopropylmalate synthase n=1 Tax=Vibrio gazogenes DSM 21264 = NBRC 103151 TaxID=1123492 RepID=A0A1M4UL48_VIBGA|nr:2-isopropylmalate synthase [Vibrio gazogenes]USP15745.1 2-isopropylmalate synthase [Vibrio gazogenes]SHE57378.1 2-isopropylmalate synthase [Vibrio gazogenes DSM 21264] [Vibrio gazogenes DSM 21264 = NBRC 103151]SJN52711.1 2-isopropylmalate synthase [Vibrio gazogenes]